MAGLIAGLLLLRDDWDVVVYERSGEELASRGAGITPHRALFEACAQAGIDFAEAPGVESRGRILLAPDGTVVDRNHTVQAFTSWGLLYRFLRAAFPDERYRSGHAVTDIVEAPWGVDLRFEDGRRDRVDRVIGADGLRSLVRGIVSPETVPAYAGYIAWRGLVVESRLPAEFREELERGMTFYLPPGEHCLGYTVAGPHDTLTRGERWYNWVWYRPLPAGNEFDAVFTDDSGHLHTSGIPPGRIRREWLAALRADAQACLPPQFQAAVERTEQPFIQPIVELASNRLIRGRCVLIGDAAFTARPHIGLGVSKAAGDAASLARAIAGNDESIETTMAAWEAERLAYGQAALARSADLGCYLSGPPGNPQEQARYEHFRSAPVVLSQIAAAEIDVVTTSGAETA